MYSYHWVVCTVTTGCSMTKDSEKGGSSGIIGREGHSLTAKREPPGNAFSDQTFPCTATVSGFCPPHPPTHKHTQASSGCTVNDKAHLHLVSNKTTHRFGSTQMIRIHGATCYINIREKHVVISAVNGCGYKHEMVVVINMK